MQIPQQGLIRWDEYVLLPQSGFPKNGGVKQVSVNLSDDEVK
jgi:hypothetical protein